jgi:hypothetical protein
MVDLWTSIPLMALGGLVALALLVVLSVTDQRRSEPVPVDREHAPARRDRRPRTDSFLTESGGTI